MKSALFAAALVIGTAAYAQTEPPATGSTVAPGNQAPARDARGIAVVSDAAVAPPGFNQPPQPGGTGAAPTQPPAPQPETGTPPPCSRTVTDNCVQTYERGRSPQ